MPLSPIAEFLIQPLAELTLQVVGYFTSRIIVPAFTLGFVYVEPGPQKETVVPKLGSIQKHGYKYIMDAELGALFGVIFWFIIGVSAIVYFKNT